MPPSLHLPSSPPVTLGLVHAIYCEVCPPGAQEGRSPSPVSAPRHRHDFLMRRLRISGGSGSTWPRLSRRRPLGFIQARAACPRVASARRRGARARRLAGALSAAAPRRGRTPAAPRGPRGARARAWWSWPRPPSRRTSSGGVGGASARLRRVGDRPPRLQWRRRLGAGAWGRHSLPHHLDFPYSCQRGLSCQPPRLALRLRPKLRCPRAPAAVIAADGALAQAGLAAGPSWPSWVDHDDGRRPPRPARRRRVLTTR